MENRKILLKSAMESGLIVGLIFIVLNLISYFFNLQKAGILFGIISFVVLLGLNFFLLFYYTKQLKNKKLEGKLTFMEGWIYGLFLSFFSSLILGFFLLILNGVIDPDLPRKTFEDSKEIAISTMQKMNVPEDKIDEAIEEMSKQPIPSALKIAYNSIMFSIILGTILSLISAGILKSPKNPFEETN